MGRSGIEAMRVTVSGASGSGKATFAANLARAIGARHIDLHRGDPEEFQRRVSAAAAQARRLPGS